MKLICRYAPAVVLTFAALFGLAAAGRTWARSQPMELATPTGTLHGTLELPAGHAPFPVALIIAGSGPTDRNGNDLSAGLDTDCYQLLAQYLAHRGIASLRYDKRGAGVDFILALPESQLRLETYVSDAVGWGRLLRRDPRFSTLTVIGHSEGSLIGLLAAPRMPADAFVSIAGAGERASRVLLTQLQGKLPGDLYRASQAIVGRLAAGETASRVPPDLDALFRPSVQPYLISWFRYDPSREIAKLRMPVLILQGDRDLQVTAADARALHRADPAATLVLIPRMNHVMKDVGATIQENQRAYANPRFPLDATLAGSVASFILHLPQREERP